MNSLAVVIKYQLRAARGDPFGVIFTLLVPLLLFALFGLIFGLGQNQGVAYAEFVLPGMIGVMCSSDALYMVGPMIRTYLTQGLAREFKSLPFWTGHLFLGFAATRLIFVMISMACLIVASAALFSHLPGGAEALRILVGAAATFAAYALLAVGISLLANSSAVDYGFASVYHFLGMFLCDAFFVLFENDSMLYALAFAFPLKPALLFMRGEDWPLAILAAWMLAGLALVVLVLRRQASIRAR